MMQFKFPACNGRHFVLIASTTTQDEVLLSLEKKDKDEDVRVLFRGTAQEFGHLVSFLDNRLQDIEAVQEILKKDGRNSRKC
jgi:hypothetical protein